MTRPRVAVCHPYTAGERRRNDAATGLRARAARVRGRVGHGAGGWRALVDGTSRDQGWQADAGVVGRAKQHGVLQARRRAEPGEADGVRQVRRVGRRGDQPGHRRQALRPERARPARASEGHGQDGARCRVRRGRTRLGGARRGRRPRRPRRPRRHRREGRDRLRRLHRHARRDEGQRVVRGLSVYGPLCFARARESTSMQCIVTATVVAVVFSCRAGERAGRRLSAEPPRSRLAAVSAEFGAARVPRAVARRSVRSARRTLIGRSVLTPSPSQPRPPRTLR